jgi:hypothetical protein
MAATVHNLCGLIFCSLHHASLALRLVPLRPYAAGSIMANTCCELFSSWNSLLGVGQAFGTLHLADSDLEQVMSSAWVKAYPGMAGRNWSASYPFCNTVAFQLGCAAMPLRRLSRATSTRGRRGYRAVPLTLCRRSSRGCTIRPARPPSWLRSVAGSPTGRALPSDGRLLSGGLSAKPSISGHATPLAGAY